MEGKEKKQRKAGGRKGEVQELVVKCGLMFI